MPLHTPINLASTTLSSAYTPGDGHLSCTSILPFGSPSASAPVRVTVGSTIYSITGTSGSTLLIGSVIEGTSDASHASGTAVKALITAGTIQELQDAIGAITPTIGTTAIAGSTAGEVLIVGAGGVLQQTANAVFTTGSYADPAWLTSLASAKVVGDIAGQAANVTGTVAIAHGGTGQVTAAAAITALLPAQASNSGKFLTTDGTAASWGIPPLTIGVAVIGGTAGDFLVVDGSGHVGQSATVAGSAVSGDIAGNAANVTGTVAIAHGGTGQVTASAAFNALSPVTTTGDLIYGSGANTAARLAGPTAATKQFLTSTGTGTAAQAPAWGTISGADVAGNIAGNAANVTGTVAIANGGTGAATQAAALNALLPTQAANSGKVLTTDGTNASWTAASGGGSLAIGSAVSGGTANDVLVVDASGKLGQVATLPIAQGGTGQATAAAGLNALLPSQATNSGKFLTTDGANASWATVASGSLAIGSAVTGATANDVLVIDGSGNLAQVAQVPISQGGTGQATASAAYNALSPLTTLGDLVYGSAANTASRLAGNTASTKKFLSQTGTGTVSAAPSWTTLAAADVGLGSVENTALSTWPGSTNLTTLGTVATGTWNATAIGISKGGTGQASAAAAFNALSPLTTTGDIIYASAANTASRLAGPTSATKQFLTSTGTGAAAQAPAWGTLAAGDVPKALDHTWVTDFDTQVRTSRLDQMAAPTASVSLNGQKITSLLDPTSAQDAATKNYVDSNSGGVRAYAYAATTAALAANTYSNGTSGVGATLTATANGYIGAIDGYSPGPGETILVKNEGAAANNGLYTVTQAGDATHPYILTRHAAMNSSTAFIGAVVGVVLGTTNAGGLFQQSNSTTPFTVGATSATFAGLNRGADLSQGTGISISGNQVSVSPSYAGQSTITTVGTIATGTWAGTTVGIAHGGTGQTSAAAAFNALSPITTTGDLIYGNGASSADRLAGPTGVTKQFLTSTGTGSAAQAPAWGGIDGGDISTGVVPVLRGGTGAATAGQGLNNLLPSQSGAAGQFLTSNGTDASWATVTGGGGMAIGSAVTSGTAGSVLYLDASTDLAQSANLTYASGTLTAVADADTTTPVVVKANSSTQSAPLVECRTSTGVSAVALLVTANDGIVAIPGFATGALPAGMFTEAGGQLFSYGVNVDQTNTIGSRVDAKDGAIFRLDCRGTPYPFFNIIHQPAGSTSYTSDTVPLCVTTGDCVRVGNTGGTNTSNGTLEVTPLTTTTVGLAVKANSGQSADAFQTQDSAGNPLFRVDPTGAHRPAHLADSSAPNDSIYYSTTQSKLCYKDPGGTVNVLY